MAVLIGMDGRRLNRTLPRAGGGGLLTGMLPALWSDGDTWDSKGDHGTSRLVSYDRIYRTQPAVASCIDFLTQQIAVIPIRVLKVNGGDNKTPVTSDSDPLRKLLSRPAPRRSEFDLKQWLAMPALTHGNGLVAKFREQSDGPPVALLPVNWQYTSAYAEQGMPVEWWSTTQTGDERFFPVEESVHFAWQSPGGEIGTSPLEQLGTTVQLEDASQRYSVASFRNGVRPSLAVVLPPDQNQSVADEVRKAVQAGHGGVDQNFLTMVIGGGATIQQLSHTAVEAELVEQRRLNFEETCRVYHLAPQLLGDARNASYNTMSEVQKLLYKTTLMPWLELMRATIQAQLIDGEEQFDGREIAFDFRDQLRGTPSEELASIVQAITNGVMAVNEGRAILGLAALPDAQFDEPMVPTNNMTPAAAVGDGRADPNNPAGARGGSPAAIESQSSSQQ